LPHIRCPVLAIQGHDDEYGTMAQLDELQRLSKAELLKLENCGHSPFRDQLERTLEAVAAFIRRT
jgi:pimeloyl-ACP methyl ester carboxylesterase